MRARLTIGMLAVLAAVPAASAQTLAGSLNGAPPADSVVISRYIYGHFAEMLGRDIYDGVWYREGNGPWHLRQEVVAALKKIKVPVLRWPGGCFADYYHWKDAIGPQAQRAPIVNSSWGGVVEDNSFGTHEYFELVKALGTEAFVVGNVGSGTVQEMVDWWDYINHPGGSPMANLRKANGQAEPFGGTSLIGGRKLMFWGVGNESWGCGGRMTAPEYATEYRRHAEYLRNMGDRAPFFIATGPNGADTTWMAGFLANARLGGRAANLGIDLHYYTRPNRAPGQPLPQQGQRPAGAPAQGGAAQGPQLIQAATGFGENEWFAIVRNALRIDELVTMHSAIMDRYDPQKRIWLVVGEWGTWYSQEPGSHPGFLYQQNSLRDAVVAAIHFDVFNKHADRVRMANIAQTINVLQAMILTEGPKVILTPTYHVFEMYTVHHDATLLPITYDAGGYTVNGETIPAITASASRKDGLVHVTMANLDPNQGRTVTVALQGTRATKVSGRILTGATMDAHNTFDKPNTIQPVPFNGAQLAGGNLTVQLPAKSVIVLELQ
ncbi:MAG: alpha-N-arabinofuranosidase [Gemmatimonadetes bacterium]|nr:alpha-N-arabinofuranosidase [Gemmatimonadota bacterium]